MFRVYTDPSPCPRLLSLTLHVAISSDADVRVRPRLCNAHAQSHPFTWSLPRAIIMSMASDPSLGCIVKKLSQGLRHWLGHGCSDSVSVNTPLTWDHLKFIMGILVSMKEHLCSEYRSRLDCGAVYYIESHEISSVSDGICCEYFN